MSWFTGAQWGGDAEGWVPPLVTGGGGGGTATLDPAHKSSYLTLSNGNLRATTSTGDWGNVLATKAYDGGANRIFKVTMGLSATGAIGFATTAVTLNSNPMSGQAVGIGFFPHNPVQLEVSASSVQSWSGFTNPGVGGVYWVRMTTGGLLDASNDGGATWQTAYNVTSSGFTATALYPCLALIDTGSGEQWDIDLSNW
jgi:hypothetical protein